MDLILYIMLWIMGTVFGSFFTLAVYRIPLKKDITHERSFCTTCNHRLEFLDLIPVFSYIFLKGKCRYCGEKIRIRYLLLEVLSGFVFVLAYMSMHMSVWNLSIEKCIHFSAFIMVYVTLAITAGIDKEYQSIHKGVMLFGVILQTAYILYLYILEDLNVYRYSIYFLFIMIAFFMNCKWKSYILQIILLSTYILYVVDLKWFFIILASTVYVILIWYAIQAIVGCIQYIKLKKWDTCKIQKKKIPVAFFMSITTIGMVILKNFLIDF